MLMKKVIFIAALLSASASLHGFAETFEFDGIFYEITGRNPQTCRVTTSQNVETDYRDFVGEAIIPAQVQFRDSLWTVTEIGQAFNFCPGLSAVSIPETVTKIGMAFCRCDSLKEVVLPASVRSLDLGFRFNTNLKRVYILGTEAPSGFETTFWECAPKSTLFVPKGSMTGYKEHLYENSFSQIREADFSQGYDKLTDYDFEFNGFRFNILSESDRTCSLTWTDKPNTSDNPYITNCLTIPLTATFNGKNYTVTQIGNSALYGSDYIFEITIPASIVSIDKNAFGYGNEYKFRPVKTYAMGNVPPHGLYISGSSHSSLFIPKGAKEAYKGWGKFSRTKEVDFTNGTKNLFSCDFIVDSISYNIISEAERTCAATWPDSYNTHYFYKKELTIPATVSHQGTAYTVTSIENESFMNLYISELSIPETVETIGKDAFRNCSFFSEVVIPDKVRELDGTFAGCSNLQSITLGKKMENINGAFADCPAIRQITSRNATPPYLSRENFQNGDIIDPHNIYAEAKVLVPATAVERYRNDGAEFTGEYFGWHLFANIDEDPNQPDNRIELSGMSFILKDDGKAMLTSSATPYDGNLTVPSTITVEGKNYIVDEIDSYTFNGCSQLTSLTIPSTIMEIGRNAFNNCSSLINLTIEDAEAALTFSDNTFTDSHLLKNIDLGRNVNVQFDGFSNLVSVTVGGKVTIVNGFNNCSSLSALTLSEGLKKIDGFSNTNLSAVKFPESIESISGFDNTGINSVEFPASVESISGFNNTLLSSLNLPSKLKSISGFDNCKNLIEIVIPDSVTTVSGFSECPSVKSVHIGKKVKSMEGFRNTPAKEIVIGSSVREMNEGCFLTWNGSGYESPEKVWFLCPEPPEYPMFVQYAVNAEIYIPLGSIEKYRENSFFENCNLIETDLSHMEPFDCKEGDVYVDVTSSPEGTCTITSGDAPCTGDVQIPANVNYEGKSYDVTVIGTNAFADNTGLTGISVPNTVTTVSDGAFSGCTALNKVELGEVVSYIAMSAFTGCTSISEVHSMNSEAPGSQPMGRSVNTLFEPSVYENATLYIPVGSKASYMASPLWNGFKTVVEKEFSSITEIADDTYQISIIGNTVEIKGMPAGTQMHIYSIDGKNIYTANHYDGSCPIFTAPAPGIFIVKIADKSFKLSIR